MKIICIGWNYKAHIAELNSAMPEKPVLFLKPETALLNRNLPFFLPDFSNDVQYEAEVVLHINKVGKNISPKFAHTYYDSIGVGIDFTARDLQRECKAKGQPWEIAKGFDYSAVVNRFIEKDKLPAVDNLHFRLELNGEVVQQGCTADMIFSCDEIIAYASQFFTLKMGDPIFTGTPVGVGRVQINDKLKAYLEDECVLDFKVK